MDSSGLNFPKIWFKIKRRLSFDANEPKQHKREICKSEGESVCRTWEIHSTLKWKQSRKRE